jgi:hypothetical protein
MEAEALWTSPRRGWTQASSVVSSMVLINAMLTFGPQQSLGCYRRIKQCSIFCGRLGNNNNTIQAQEKTCPPFTGSVW